MPKIDLRNYIYRTSLTREEYTKLKRAIYFLEKRIYKMENRKSRIEKILIKHSPSGELKLYKHY